MDNLKVLQKGTEEEIEINALEEEKQNISSNYSKLERAYNKISSLIPYPDVTKYSVASFPDEIDDLQYKKRCNQIYWSTMERIGQYKNRSKLFCGHLLCEGQNIFFTEKNGLGTLFRDPDVPDLLLVSVDDKKYSYYFDKWHYPDKNVPLSRNIYMEGKEVIQIDVIRDMRTSIYSEYNDNFLREALLKNKDKIGLSSIIRTIQQEQNSLRSLPKEKEFIVQGCAGSGKTMVMLHRMRYLIHNGVKKSSCLLLGPNSKYVNFINGICDDFGINDNNNVMSFQQFYSRNELIDEEDNELLFPSFFLNIVYSREFIQRIYRRIFGLVKQKNNDVIKFCQDLIETQIENEKNKGIDLITQETVNKVKEITNQLTKFTSTKIDSIESVKAFSDEIKIECNKVKQNIDSYDDDNYISKLVEKDLKFVPFLHKLKNEINKKKKDVETAPIFTKSAHQNKLNALIDDYNRVKEEYIKNLTIKIKRKLSKEKESKAIIYNCVGIKEAEEILEKIDIEIKKNENEITELEKQFDSIENIKNGKYNEQIKELNNAIEYTDNLDVEIKYIKPLSPGYSYFHKQVDVYGKLLSNIMLLITSEKDKKNITDRFKLFLKKDYEQVESYLATTMFRICRHEIMSQFKITLSKKYKHYWYLRAYCKYLLKQNKRETYDYIFIDEAQDLSIMEFELINKLNANGSTSIMNLFGDINQVISSHCIQNWSDFNKDFPIYKLDQNFRNTNQITKFCNKNLPTNMKMMEVGIDMDEVKNYKTIDSAINYIKKFQSQIVFIVKNEKIGVNVKKHLAEFGIITDSIYSVAKVKGIEFNEVFVISMEMTDNEKYIAYTRPLTKLNVIESVPMNYYVDPINHGDNKDDEL